MSAPFLKVVGTLGTWKAGQDAAALQNILVNDTSWTATTSIATQTIGTRILALSDAGIQIDQWIISYPHKTAYVPLVRGRYYISIGSQFPALGVNSGKLPAGLSVTSVGISGTVSMAAGAYYQADVRTTGTGYAVAFWIYDAPVASSTPTTTTPPPTDTTSGARVGILSWPEARAAAQAGSRITRTAWVDRWVEYSGCLWWLQLINPTTLATLERRVVQAPDWDADCFTKSDWLILP